MITTDAHGCAEVVDRAALLTRPENVNDIRAALARLMNDEQEVKRLSELSRERAAKFTWRRIAGQFDRLFWQTCRSTQTTN